MYKGFISPAFDNLSNFIGRQVRPGYSVELETVNLQVTRLKRAAESRFDSILKSIRHDGTTPSPAISLSSGPADLQARLEAAIGVLQDGLIERDTEVSSCVAAYSLHAPHC